MADSSRYERLRAIAENSASTESERATARRMMEDCKRKEAESQEARAKADAADREAAKRAALAAFGGALKRLGRYF